MTLSPGGGGDARNWKRKNGSQKASKSGGQLECRISQNNKHPATGSPVNGTAEKDNGRMNGDNRLQALNTYAFHVETKPHGKRA